MYQWTPTTSGIATIDTCDGTGTTFDTVIYMRQGTCGAGTQEACNDDTTGCAVVGDGTNPHRGSRLRPSVVAGQTYYIIVDGYNGTTGSFTLNITPP